ncbi:MAG: hypothetical protein ACOZAK_02860 [Patescibacteria group bacterium]
MTTPKFSDNSLVVYQDGIYRVLDLATDGPGYHYKLLLVAYQRDMEPAEFHQETITPQQINVEESLLSEFKDKAPRFKFGEGVRLNGEINCLVKFVEYKNYKYYYVVREKVHWSSELQDGWEVEESYLQKW